MPRTPNQRNVDEWPIERLLRACKIDTKTDDAVLDLSMKGFNSHTLPKALKDVASLSVLKLNSNQISEFPLQALGKLLKLHTLDLSWNKMNSLPRVPPTMFTSLRVLNLSFNGMTRLHPSVSNITTLTELHLNDNKLTVLPPEIARLRCLEVLDLSYNMLTSLPSEIASMTELNTLQVMGNDLVYPPARVVFGGLAGMLRYMAEHPDERKSLPFSSSSSSSSLSLSASNNEMVEQPPTEAVRNTPSFVHTLSVNSMFPVTATPTPPRHQPYRSPIRKQKLSPQKQQHNRNFRRSPLKTRTSATAGPSDAKTTLMSPQRRYHAQRKQLTPTAVSLQREADAKTRAANFVSQGVGSSGNMDNGPHSDDEERQIGSSTFFFDNNYSEDDIEGVRRILQERGSHGIVSLFDDLVSEQITPPSSAMLAAQQLSSTPPSHGYAQSRHVSASYNQRTQQQQQVHVNLPSEEEMRAQRNYYRFLTRHNERTLEEKKASLRQTDVLSRDSSWSGAIHGSAAPRITRSSPTKSPSTKKHEPLPSVVKTKPTQAAEIPDAFLCPITYEVMKVPVVAADGHTYERSAIEKWFEKKDRSPMTGETLVSKLLTPNHTLKSMIAMMKQQQQQ